MDYPQYVVEEELFQKEIEKGSLIKTLINSTIAFLIAYLFVYIIFQLVTIVVASYYQIETDWFYYKLNFLAVTMSPLWHSASVKAIFSVGPIISLILAIFYLLVYLYVYKDKPGLMKLIFLWASMISFNRFFGEFIGGVVAYNLTDRYLGFVYVTNWMYLSRDIENWFAVISMIILLSIGYFYTGYFLSTSYSRYFLFNNMMKFSFKVNAVFLPVVFGTIIIFFIKLPITSMEEIMYYLSYNMYELISYATMILMVLPVFNNYNTQIDLSIQIVDEDRKQYIHWKFLVFVILFYVAYRVLLDPAAGFGLHFNVMENGFDIDNYLIRRNKL